MLFIMIANYQLKQAECVQADGRVCMKDVLKERLNPSEECSC